MEKLSNEAILSVSGAMKIEGLRPSNNIYDGRGKDMGDWISAGMTCWKPGTPTYNMFVAGYPPFRF